MLLIEKPPSFSTLLLTELLKTVIVCMDSLINAVNVINNRYSPFIYKLAFSNYIRKGSAQIPDSTFLEATQEKGKLTCMHHYHEPNVSFLIIVKGKDSLEYGLCLHGIF